jgi:hypothetical protein
MRYKGFWPGAPASRRLFFGEYELAGSETLQRAGETPALRPKPNLPDSEVI